MSDSQITIKQYIAAPAVQDKMKELLVSPDLVRQFTTSVISLSGQDKLLAEAEPRSLFNAALTAASLNLPINKNLGFAHIIGYKDNKKGIVEAQFQMGARGFRELAQRSGRYTIIHEGDVRQGEMGKRNRLTGEIDFKWEDDDEKRLTLPVIGYFSYFKLDNGFSSTLYMSVQEIKDHAKRYSQSYKKGFGPWVDNFPAMCIKTVMKLNVSKNGPLDINLQKAVTVDQAVIKDDDKVEYIDGEEVEVETLSDDQIDAINAADFDQLKEIQKGLSVELKKQAAPYVAERMKSFNG